MTDSKPVRAKGTTRYDLVGMPDEDFEAMNARLIRLEFPKAVKPANTRDGGADMVLPRAGGGYDRCWQSKHFPNAINWTKCKESLAAAKENWKGIAEYTFCFPRELTNAEQKTFDKHFRGPDADIEVNYWNGDELQARLTGSDEGQRIARTFFEDVELDRENVYRAIEAGGRLDTPQDALDRLGNIGGFLASKDAYFSYPATTHESDEPGPPLTLGAVMSYGESEGAITRRIDIVPRDDEAMHRYGPELVIQPAEGELGERAAAQLQEALGEGKAIEIGEGLDLTFTRLPPALDDMVGKRLTGASMRFGKPERVSTRPQAKPWKARLQANTDRGTASVDLDINQAESVPDGWDDMFEGRFGGMTATLLTRWREGQGGELRWNFTHQRDKSPVHDQLAALRFMTAFSGAGEFVVTDIGGSGRPEQRTPVEAREFGEDTDQLIAFLEDLYAIVEWADVEFELPETITGRDAHDVATIARIIRAGGRSVTWHNVEIVLDEAALPRLREGGVMRVEHKAAAAVLGQVVDLGYARVDLPAYTVMSTTPIPDSPGIYTARVEPVSEESSKIFEQLAKVRTKEAARAGRPPPPPPRRRRRGKGGKGGGRKKKRRP